ncbi:hypothetical protein RND81_12G225800 [Saponaria officinalis]|uniref:NAC domain-containing protein n=1 Tax=Saponaria officinalis TaxID=3572 RepID=A0AAW1HE71_SAPOF
MGESDSKKTATSLAPGFRFHPTDEELVWYYLRRKVSGKPFRIDAISEIDIYKVEPTDLPGLSKLKTRDKEWYFFSALDRKYGNGMRTNRATVEGYWKTTGKDRPVHHYSRTVGMKKTLVYHFGRAPRGKRTDWVMHEYKLVDDELDKAGYPLEGYVLCRIFRKSGTGPKNGEQYGAPLVDEEWEDNEAENTINVDVSFEDPYVDDDAFIEQNDLVQDLDLLCPQAVPLPDELDNQGSQNYVEESKNSAGSDQRSTGAEHEYECEPQPYNDQEIFDLLTQVGCSPDIVKNEYMPQVNDDNNEALPDEPCTNAGFDAPVDDGLYFDAAEFLDSAEGYPLDDGAFGPYFDDDIDIGAFLNFDSHPELTGTDANQAFTIDQNPENSFWNIPVANNQLARSSDDGAGSSSKQALVDKQSRTALSKANCWLENIPAHPAFASELPSKDMASRLSAAVQSSSSTEVTAGMIRIRDVPIGATGSGLQWSFDKTGSVNVLLSFELPQTVGPAELESLSSMSSSKLAAAVSRGWLYFLFLWVMFFAVSIKVGTCIYAK